jgi:hypothetical protein
MNEQQTEAAIVAAGKTAPRVTPADVDAAIVKTHFINAGSAIANAECIPSYETHVSVNLLTICVLVLRNGFTVTGESACASPENFDPKIGRDIAYRNAREKIWPLLGYALREKLAAG